jgi:hypothetical protein
VRPGHRRSPYRRTHPAAPPRAALSRDRCQ